MAFEKLGTDGVVITGEADVRLARLMMQGLKMSRGHSVFAIVKAEFNLKGSKAKVLAAFTKIVEKMKQERLTPACPPKELEHLIYDGCGPGSVRP